MRNLKKQWSFQRNMKKKKLKLALVAEAEEGAEAEAESEEMDFTIMETVTTTKDLFKVLLAMGSMIFCLMPFCLRK